MNSDLSNPSSISFPILPTVGVGIVATGVLGNGMFDYSLRTIPAILLIAIGLYVVVTSVREERLDQLRTRTKRWWVLAVGAFIPYGIVASPSSERAATVGNALQGTYTVSILEAIAGATVLCAIAVTTLFVMAAYGIHPGRPTPEEHILDDAGSD